MRMRPGGDGRSVVDSPTSGHAALMGLPENVVVERGLFEFRSGRPIIMTGSGERLILLPVDGMDDGQLAAFRQLCIPRRLDLLITARRAQSLGLAADGPIALSVEPGDGADAILSLAADAHVERHLEGKPAS